MTAYPEAHSEYTRLSLIIIFTMLNCNNARITAIAPIYWLINPYLLNKSNFHPFVNNFSMSWLLFKILGTLSLNFLLIFLACFCSSVKNPSRISTFDLYPENNWYKIDIPIAASQRSAKPYPANKIVPIYSIS